MKVLKWIRFLWLYTLVLIYDTIAMNSEDAIAALNALQNLIPHPRTHTCLRADEDTRNTGSLQRSVDKAL